MKAAAGWWARGEPRRERCGVAEHAAAGEGADALELKMLALTLGYLSLSSQRSRGSVAFSWQRRWTRMLSVAAANAFANGLVATAKCAQSCALDGPSYGCG